MTAPARWCGYTVGSGHRLEIRPGNDDGSDDPAVDGAVCCRRPVSGDRDRCVWHADVDGKAVSTIRTARADAAERLDGAMLSGVGVGADVSFAECSLAFGDLRGSNFFAGDLENAVLHGADLTDASLSRANLRGADLTDVTLTGADLREVDLTGARLHGADLTGADLREATLSDANLADATLVEARMDRIDLGGAYLQGADLHGATISAADLSGADLLNADLSGSTLRGSDLAHTALFDADLSEADLDRAELVQADILDADLSAAKLFGADLSGANLRGAVLTDADLRMVDLHDGDLRMVSLVGADLDRADLSRATLAEADLSLATLRNTTIAEATLADADLEKATAHGCDLTRSDLTRADLTQTNLFDATLDRAHLYGAVFDNTRINEATSMVAPHDQPGPDDTEDDRLTKAAWSHRRIEGLSQENSLPEQARHHYRKRKDLQREQYWIRGGNNYLRWAQSWLSNLLIRYGDSPVRVVVASVVIVLVCAALFPVLGGTSPPLSSELQQLYFSVITFTTLGYGDFSPATEPAQLLATLEAFVGSLMMALVVFVLGRRATW